MSVCPRPCIVDGVFIKLNACLVVIFIVCRLLFVDAVILALIRVVNIVVVGVGGGAVVVVVIGVTIVVCRIFLVRRLCSFNSAY